VKDFDDVVGGVAFFEFFGCFHFVYLLYVLISFRGLSLRILSTTLVIVIRYIVAAGRDDFAGSDEALLKQT